MSKRLKNKHVQFIYDLVNKRDEYLYRMFRLLDKNDLEYYKSKEYAFTNYTVEIFSKKLNLELNDELKLSLLNRLILLREDDLLKTFEVLKFDEEKQIELRKIAYDFTETFQMNIQKILLLEICNSKIPKFYKELLKGVFQVGLSMNSLNKVWDDTLLNKVNKELERDLKDKNIIEYLKEKNLLEIDSRTNSFADRSYSILKKIDKDNYIVEPYSVAFPQEVKSVVINLNMLISKLINVSCKNKDKDLYREHNNWIKYFTAIRDAFEETDKNNLIQKWAYVDTLWMQIDSPIQVGHPLEYYEDKYRSAVCIEFDVRIDNIEASSKNNRVESSNFAFSKIFNELIENDKNGLYNKDTLDSIKTNTLKNLSKTQVHIGKQMFYFGASLNGLSSAQVVPNDEIVSEKEGKKIFAFAEKALNLNRAKPHLLINKKVFGYDYMDKYYELLHNRPEDFLFVYDVTTIGHEYGHILFKNENSEIKMNDSGMYKNIEEFKASAGGLVSYFIQNNDKNEDEIKCEQEIFNNTISRAVNLIGWKKQSETEAYYCEGLITLKILFDSNVLSFDKKNQKLIISNNRENYKTFKNNYINIYKDLANTYLLQKDANSFLSKFCQREEDGYMYPISSEVKDLVNYFFELQLKEGKILDLEYKKHLENILDIKC